MAFMGLYDGLEDKLKEAGSNLVDKQRRSAANPGDGLNAENEDDGPALKRQRTDSTAPLAAFSTLYPEDEPQSHSGPTTSSVGLSSLKRPPSLVKRTLPTPVTRIPSRPLNVSSAPTTISSLTTPISLSADLSGQAGETIHITKILSELKDPYDPLKPTDYQEYLNQREQAKASRRLEELQSLGMIKPLQPAEASDVAVVHAPISGISDYMETDGDDIDGVPISTSNLAVDDDDLDGVPISNPSPAPASAVMGPPPPMKPGGAKKGRDGSTMSVAEKMMLKMGWKGSGHGLGKHQQGIAEPVLAVSTGVAGQGIIIAPRTSQPTFITMPETRVIILTNMVAPGQVDDALLPEVAQECKKYGTVLECEVRETLNVAPEYAVQIFIKFQTREAAFAALGELDGRVFGGRIVRGDPFDEAKFDRRDFSSGGILANF